MADNASKGTDVRRDVGYGTMVPSLKILPESLVGMADKALYRAKRQGRNQVLHSFDLEAPTLK